MYIHVQPPSKGVESVGGVRPVDLASFVELPAIKVSPDEVRRAHGIRTKHRKAPTAPVQIPAALVLPGRESPDCAWDCIACGLTRRRRAGLTKDTAGRLAYGRGVPLRVLLTLYRWARAYAGVPLESPPDTRTYNATARLSTGELALETLGAAGHSEQMAVSRAVKLLGRLNIVTVVEDPGRPSIFVPHAIGTPFRIPQHLWRGGHLGLRESGGELALGGQALLLLIALMSLPRLDFKDVTGRRTTSPLLLTPEDSVVGLVSYSTSQQRRALAVLEKAGLLARFRTRGHAMLAVLEPP